MIIWDRGFYRHPSDGDGKESERLLLEGLKKGDMKFVLEGEKLQGEFALVKTRKDEKSWLLLKKKDRYATTEDILAENRSVVSDRTLEDLSASRTEDIFPARKKRTKSVSGKRWKGKICKDAPVTPMPHHIKPMLATLIKEPFDHPDWLFEVKWDGYRAVAEIRDGNVSLYSRNRTLVQPEVFSHCRTRSGNSDSMPFWTAKSSSWTIGAMPISRCCRIT